MRTFVVLAALLATSADARAETDGDAYCRWVGGVAGSASALLLAPQIYVNYGYINGDTVGAGAVNSGTAFHRLTAGLRYSMSEVTQGAMTRKRAAADCVRYRALAQLNAFLESAKELESRKALAAKVAVLAEAVPHAEAILRAAQSASSSGYQTVEQLNATQLKVDALKEQLSEARQALAIAEQRPLPPQGSIGSLRRAREAAERDVERAEGRLRRTQAWDLVLRGGYDRIFGVRDQVPVFAFASLSFNLGGLAQRHFDHLALDGRTAYERLDPAGADQRAEAVLKQYEVMARGDAERLQQTRTLLVDLEHRMQAVDGLEGQRASMFRDYLWFDLIRLRAEAAYLEAHLHDLEAYRGDRS
jgi:hypothetical protein